MDGEVAGTERLAQIALVLVARLLGHEPVEAADEVERGPDGEAIVAGEHPRHERPPLTSGREKFEITLQVGPQPDSEAPR